MTAAPTRYPGAQPFADDDLSRKVFFGREQASLALTNQILANRLVVVYAKSGLGKSSLLNAGVAQRLRDEGYLPLIVRVNDIEHGPFVSVLEGIQAAAERQKVEYVPGNPESLWTFFKTVEFWRGDLLLTPVLILDQFEELFTLQGPDARTAFVADLGHLVRGVRPPSAAAADPDLSETPPALRVVLSLREDYLGFLDEAADRIPQILDHRFRLTPLTVEAAAEAMTGPAGIDDPAFQSKPFQYDPETVATILNYLSQRMTKSVAEKAACVEPFHLQLICQRVEAIAASRQHQSQAGLTITMNHIGGEAALKRTLKEFYSQALRALPKKRVRRAVRRLCEEYLISPEGRRLSLEEHEIRRQVKLPAETLQQLVNSRLLRSDNRSDSTYYELSHDAIVEPVLDTSRTRALLFGWLGVVTNSVISLLLGAMGFLFLVSLAVDQPETEVVIVGLILAIFFFYWGVISIALLRRNYRTVQRFRRRNRVELAEPEQVTGRTRDWVLGWLGITGGSFILIVSAFFCAFTFGIAIRPLYSDAMPKLPAGSAQIWQSVHDFGIGLDWLALVVSVLASLLFSFDVYGWSVRRLLGRPRHVPVDAAEQIPNNRPMLNYAVGGAGLLAGVAMFFAAAYWAGPFLLSLECAGYFAGKIPDWLSQNWLNRIVGLATDCQSRFETGFKWIRILELLPTLLLLLYGTRFLRRGLRMICGLRRPRRAAPAVSG